MSVVDNVRNNIVSIDNVDADEIENLVMNDEAYHKDLATKKEANTNKKG